MSTTTTDTIPAMSTDTTAAQYWAAPANLDRIYSGASSWGIYVRGGNARKCDLIALPLNHYSVGVWNRQPGGRTPGRALRACRRWLRRSPIRFDGGMAETYSAGNRADRRMLSRWLQAEAQGLAPLSVVLAVLPVAQERHPMLHF